MYFLPWRALFLMTIGILIHHRSEHMLPDRQLSLQMCYADG
jgi:hypothetical protein